MIKLIKCFPYDNTYDYVKLHSSVTAQKDYFKQFDFLIITDDEEIGYIKEGNSFIINYNYDYLVSEGVNYVIFNNGYKDLYCFITEKEYVDEECSRLHYEIDVLNTFFNDIKLNKSFVERKQCSINEITDYDEGLEIGEHEIVQVNHIFDKDSTYLAMFNGFKEQELIFNDSGKLVSAVDIPYATAKPQTTIDNILYPMYFMKLLDSSQYEEATFTDIGIGTGGSEVVGEAISKKLYRFIKGYEAFSADVYVDSGNVPTIGYGITEVNPYWNSLFPRCTEQKASEVLAETIFSNYATPLYKDMQKKGVDMAMVKQSHFDAFLDLCFNGGLGAVTSSPMYKKWVIDSNDSTVTDGWEIWYIKDNNGTIQDGLVDRRKKEKDIFINSNYPYKKILNIVNGQYQGYVTDNNGNGYIPPKLGGEL